MEDLINRTKAVDILRFNVLRLAQYNVPCPVCGKLMLDVNKFNEFEKNILGTTNPGKILEYIEELKKYLHPVEAKIFSMMKNDNFVNPKRTLHDMLKIKLPKSENKIIQCQSKIFTDIGILSRKLPDSQRIQVQDLLNETFTRILDPRETSRFSRIFIDKLKYAFIPQKELRKLKETFEREYVKKYKNDKNLNPYNVEQYINERIKANINKRILTPEQEAIMAKAVNLPMAYNNVDAFIVKYAKRNYKGANPDQKIAIRMLSNSLATVEHIKPQSKRGATEPKNLGLECACDNNRRGSASIIEQIIENPQMPYNYRLYMRRLCELNLSNVLEKSYITQQNKTYQKESLGLLDSDLSILRRGYKNNRSSKKYNKSGRTPSIEERRAARKFKLKNKKKTLKTRRHKKV